MVSDLTLSKMLLRGLQSLAAPKHTAAAQPSAIRFKIGKTSMKDFNNTTANVGQKILAIDALVQTAASKAYIISVEPGQELPIGVQNASYRGQDAAFIRVESDG